MKECCGCGTAATENIGYRKVLWLALAINALMFLTELVAGLLSGTASLRMRWISWLTPRIMASACQWWVLRWRGGHGRRW